MQIRIAFVIVFVSLALLPAACQREARVAGSGTVGTLTDTSGFEAFEVELSIVGHCVLQRDYPRKGYFVLAPITTGHEAYVATTDTTATVLVTDTTSSGQYATTTEQGHVVVLLKGKHVEFDAKPIERTLNYMEFGDVKYGCPCSPAEDGSLAWVPSLNEIRGTTKEALHANYLLTNSDASRYLQARMEMPLGSLEGVLVHGGAKYRFKPENTATSAGQPLQAMAAKVLYKFTVILPTASKFVTLRAASFGSTAYEPVVKIQPDANKVFRLTLGNLPPANRFPTTTTTQPFDRHFAHYYTLLTSTSTDYPIPHTDASKCLPPSVPGVDCGPVEPCTGTTCT